MALKRTLNKVSHLKALISSKIGSRSQGHGSTFILHQPPISNSTLKRSLAWNLNFLRKSLETWIYYGLHLHNYCNSFTVLSYSVKLLRNQPLLFCSALITFCFSKERRLFIFVASISSQKCWIRYTTNTRGNLREWKWPLNILSLLSGTK